MVAVVFPSSLPSPSVVWMSAAERRLLSSIADGLPQMRTLQSDFLGYENLQWEFTGAQAVVFQQWWRVTLIEGGRWFQASWPRVTVATTGVCRFLLPPKWDLIGHEYFRVTIGTELRGNAEPPNISGEVWLASTIYPALVIDSYGMTANAPKGAFQWPAPDNFALSASVISGVLTTLLRSYTNWPFEQFALTASVVSGVVTNVLRSYTNWPYEQYALSAAVVSGSIANGLDTYSMVPEQYALSAAVVSGVLT